MSNSRMIGDRMAVTCGRLYATYDRFWARPDLNLLVPSFLFLMHQIVRASVPLMERARERCEADAADPVNRVLARYLATHIAEERHHDDWLLEDLAAAGFPPPDVLGAIPSRDVAALVGAQYYWVTHHHPVALAGYMRVLEGNPPSEEHVHRLQRESGLPDAAFRTYRLHGTADPSHLRDLDLLLDTLPLSQAHLQLVWLSASHTATALADCLEAIELERDRQQGDRRGTRAGRVRPAAAG